MAKTLYDYGFYDWHVNEVMAMPYEKRFAYIEKKIDSLSWARRSISRDGYYAMYNQSVTEYKEYINQREKEYKEEVVQYEKDKARAIAKQTLVFDTEIPNYKDPDQWLAGGNLRNDTFAGGNGYSPTATPSLDNKEHSTDNNGMMLSEPLSLLNNGFNNVNYLVNGGLLDLMHENEMRNVQVISWTISLSSMAGVMLGYATGEHSFNNSDGDIHNDSEQTTNDINDIFENRFSVSQDPVSISISILNSLTGDGMTIEKTLQAGIVGTVMSGISNAITGVVTEMLGVKTIGVYLSTSLFVNVVFSELVQMALGLDTHFGFGGSFVGTSKDGWNKYEESYNLNQIKESLKETFGMDYDKTVRLEGEVGEFVGSRQTLGSGSLFGDDFKHTIDKDVYGDVLNVTSQVNDSISYINYTTGLDGYSSFDRDGNFNSSSVDGISVTKNSQGGYDVKDSNTGYSYSTNKNGSFSTNEPSYSSISGSGSSSGGGSGVGSFQQAANRGAESDSGGAE